MNKKSLIYIGLFIAEVICAYTSFCIIKPHWIGIIAGVIVMGFTAWKNHNVTKAFQIAQSYGKIAKYDGGITFLEIEGDE